MKMLYLLSFLFLFVPSIQSQTGISVFQDSILLNRYEAGRNLEILSFPSSEVSRVIDSLKRINRRIQKQPIDTSQVPLERYYSFNDRTYFDGQNKKWGLYYYSYALSRSQYKVKRKSYDVCSWFLYIPNYNIVLSVQILESSDKSFISVSGDIDRFMKIVDVPRNDSSLERLKNIVKTLFFDPFL